RDVPALGGERPRRHAALRHGEPRARARAARDADPPAEGDHGRARDRLADRMAGSPAAGARAPGAARSVPRHDRGERAGADGRDGGPGMSAMRETMWRQPADLRSLLADDGPVEAAAERLRGRRIFAIGTGTSWHAANHAAWLLREAGVDVRPVQAMDAALYGLPADGEEAVLVLSHRNTKRYSTEVVERARRYGQPTVVIGGRGSPGVDVETVEQERSAAFTASHLGALLRVAQIARLLGAQLGELEQVPDAVEAVLDAEVGVVPPERLLELTGAGPNQWTAAEG